MHVHVPALVSQECVVVVRVATVWHATGPSAARAREDANTARSDSASRAYKYISVQDPKSA